MAVYTCTSCKLQTNDYTGINIDLIKIDIVNSVATVIILVKYFDQIIFF